MALHCILERTADRIDFDVLDLVVEVEDDGISGIALYFGKSSREQD